MKYISTIWQFISKYTLLCKTAKSLRFYGNIIGKMLKNGTINNITWS